MIKHSPVPVLNALSSLWHPTQILADLLTLHEHAEAFAVASPGAQVVGAEDEQATKQDAEGNTEVKKKERKPFFTALPTLRPLTIAYLGDSTNVLHDMLVTYPRFGHKLRVATPSDAKYQCPEPVWSRVKELECADHISWSADPREAVKGADVVVTDTWFVFVKEFTNNILTLCMFRISMGQEAEKAQRLQDFQGYQVTEALCREGGASENWKFLHCLPRKPDEVDDEVSSCLLTSVSEPVTHLSFNSIQVFYGPRSLVFPEADNRKWTIMALFEYVLHIMSFLMLCQC